MFLFCFLMLQGHHLGYITFSIQIKMDMAEPFCRCTEAKPLNLSLSVSHPGYHTDVCRADFQSMSKA